MTISVENRDTVDTALLQRIPLFADLALDTQHRLAEGARLQSYQRGAVLFKAGEAPEFLHVLISGSVQLTASTDDEREAVVELLRPIDHFLLAAVLTTRPYLMSATVVEDAHILLIPSAHLLQLVTADPPLALTMLGSMAQQFRQMVRQVKDLRLRTTSQRLGIYLLHLVESEGDGNVTVLPYDKKLVAARLDMTPESLSRGIAGLRQHGVDVRHNTVRITDLDKLREFCRLDHLLDQLEADLQVIAQPASDRT